MKINTIAAVCITRRVIAVAVFSGTRLEYIRNRQLSSSRGQAERTVMASLNWLVSQFDIAVLGIFDSVADVRASHLEALAAGAGRSLGIPVWRVKTTSLLEAFSQPPLTNKQQLRMVAGDIWPVISGSVLNRSVRDAAAVGLYIQVERMLAAIREEGET